MKTSKTKSISKNQAAKKKKVAKVMHEFKEGELHSGKTDTIVTNPKQAIAIALSEAKGLDEKTKLKKINYEKRKF